MTHAMISDSLWESMLPLLPRTRKRKGKAGRNPIPYRKILKGIFWILRTRPQWCELPDHFPPKSTVHDRFQFLVKENFFRRLAEELLLHRTSFFILNKTSVIAMETFYLRNHRY